MTIESSTQEDKGVGGWGRVDPEEEIAFKVEKTCSELRLLMSPTEAVTPSVHLCIPLS